jgi:hypothetical protein
MIANGKALFDLIDAILKKEGFIKRKDTWYKHTDDCICFFTIGKSPYGGYYDHAFGFFLKDLNTTGQDFPVFYKCDLKISLEVLADKDLVKRVLNLENQQFANTEREFVINELFELYIVPFLNHVSSKDNIKSAMRKYEDLIYYLNGDARKHMKLKMPKTE